MWKKTYKGNLFQDYEEIITQLLSDSKIKALLDTSIVKEQFVQVPAPAPAPAPAPVPVLF